MRTWIASAGVLTVLAGAGIGVAAGAVMVPLAAVRPAKQVATKFDTPAGLVDLGRVSVHTTLSGKIYDLAPGGTLRIVVGETDSRGLGEIATLPKSVLSVKRTVLTQSPRAGVVAGKTPRKGAFVVEYRFTLAATVRPGRYEVRALGLSPSSAVAFDIRVMPQKTGEPRPL